MRQAIVTKYLGPTNFRGSRVKATADAGSVTISWDHALNVDENHDAAAKALALKFGWAGQWVHGGLPQKMGGNCYVNSVAAYQETNIHTGGFYIERKKE